MNATKWLAIGFVLVGVYLVTKRERPLTAWFRIWKGGMVISYSWIETICVTPDFGR
jgi:hypothetical protein